MLPDVPSPNARRSIGLAAWIIQDGNYADFNVGDRAEFALEFYAAGDVELVPGSDVHATHLHDDDRYDVVGHVVHMDERCWVLDFGLLAFHEGVVPEGVVPGQTVRACIGIGVDPFMYFERLSHDPAYPDMVYTWDIQAIRRETAPFVRSGNLWVRDQTKLARIEVQKTDA
jgi:hypothetical protein